MAKTEYENELDLECVKKSFCIAVAIPWYWDISDANVNSPLSNISYISDFRLLYNKNQDYSNIVGVCCSRPLSFFLVSSFCDYFSILGSSVSLEMFR
jgi:hypothetical protein